MIQLARSWGFNLAYVLWWSLCTLTILPLAFLLPRAGRLRAIRFCIHGMNLLLRIIAGVRYEVKGRPPTGAAIIASQHQSAWDTLIFFCLLESPVFIAKKEVLRLPPAALMIWLSGSIIVNREDGVKAMKPMVNKAVRRLEDGHQIVIFPQGTRVPAGEHLPPQPGVAAIYKKSGSNVTPVTLTSGHHWPRPAVSYLKTPGTITLSFKPAIKTGLKKHECLEKLDKVYKNG